MGMWIGRNRKARVTYGFDEIALVPGRVTINPNEVDITWRLMRQDAAPLEFKIPILASASWCFRAACSSSTSRSAGSTPRRSRT